MVAAPAVGRMVARISPLLDVAPFDVETEKEAERQMLNRSAADRRWNARR
jgi:hypothetical protein